MENLDYKVLVNLIQEQQRSINELITLVKPANKKYISLREFYTRYGCSKNTAIRLCQSGEIRATKVGNLWKVLATEVDRITAA